jgi:hypothetical protein
VPADAAAGGRRLACVKGSWLALPRGLTGSSSTDVRAPLGQSLGFDAVEPSQGLMGAIRCWSSARMRGVVRLLPCRWIAIVLSSVPSRRMHHDFLGPYI